jgi:hypothetical protein
MYLRLIDNTIVYPYTIQQLKVDNPNISFPSNLDSIILSEWNIFLVEQTPKPNDYTKNISEGIPTIIDGVYKQIWIQTDASQSEIDNRIENRWIEVREQRNQLLQETDWTQLADIPQSIKDLWSLYRQQLRDITTENNPYFIAWPVKP